MSVWADALDDFEQRLDAFRTVLDDGEAPSGLWPPRDVIDVPLPPELADRARALMTRAKELEGELIARRDSLPTPRPATRNHRVPPAFSTFSRDL
ncbi:MAG: hypothetical protein AAF531_15500 [Actinomycetota bacterium]